MVAPSVSASSAAPTGSQWQLSWQDEFNSTASLNAWSFAEGNVGGPALQQLQWYDKTNASINPQGDLVISATANGGGHQCFNGPCGYSSVRMQTEAAFGYGLIEARIELPRGQGLWPAFWMQGVNFPQVGLPAAGEIDIAELNSRAPADVLTAFAHAPGLHFDVPPLAMQQPISAGFHIYAVEWARSGITWLVDGHPYGHLAYAGSPFDHPFNIILDLAVGGSWPGPPDASTRFPAHMYVDWVRVYKAV